MLSLLLFACSTETTIPVAEASHIPQSEDSVVVHNTNDIQTLQGVISTSSQLNMAIIEADGKFHTWMEGRSGILRTEPKTSFWLEQGGVSTTKGKGQLHMEIDGHSYYTAAAVSKTPLTSKLDTPPKNTSGLAISLEMTSKGKYITSLTKKDSRNIRLASTVQKPSRSAIVQVQNPEKSLGEPTPSLSKSDLEQIKKTSKIPASGKPVGIVKAKAEQTKKWTTELQGLFGATAKSAWSTLINLDGDEFVEGLICTPTPKGPTCFVYDEINGVGRYYDSGFKWDGKTAPTVFSVNEKIYIYHNAPLKKGAVHKVLQFNGSGYNSTQL